MSGCGNCGHEKGGHVLSKGRCMINGYGALNGSSDFNRCACPKYQAEPTVNTIAVGETIYHDDVAPVTPEEFIGATDSQASALPVRDTRTGSGATAPTVASTDDVSVLAVSADESGTPAPEPEIGTDLLRAVDLLRAPLVAAGVRQLIAGIAQRDRDLTMWKKRLIDETAELRGHLRSAVDEADRVRASLNRLHAQRDAARADVARLANAAVVASATIEQLRGVAGRDDGLCLVDCDRHIVAVPRAADGEAESPCPMCERDEAHAYIDGDGPSARSRR